MSKDLMEKIKQGRNYRSMTMEIRKDGEVEEDSYIVEGYATTYNEPYVLCEEDNYVYQEQVDPNAFEGCDMEDVIMQYDHAGRVYARISNGTLELKSDDHGLLIRAHLGGTEAGRALYEEIKGGYTTKMSFGFTVAEDLTTRSKCEDGKDLYLRTITKFGKLYDVSAVSLPANDGTEISARAYVDGEIAKAEAEQARQKAEEDQKQKEEEERLEHEMRERMRLRALALEI